MIRYSFSSSTSYSLEVEVESSERRQRKWEGKDEWSISVDWWRWRCLSLYNSKLSRPCRTVWFTQNTDTFVGWLSAVILNDHHFRQKQRQSKVFPLLQPVSVHHHVHTGTRRLVSLSPTSAATDTVVQCRTQLLKLLLKLLLRNLNREKCTESGCSPATFVSFSSTTKTHTHSSKSHCDDSHYDIGTATTNCCCCCQTNEVPWWRRQRERKRGVKVEQK